MEIKKALSLSLFIAASSYQISNTSFLSCVPAFAGLADEKLEEKIQRYPQHLERARIFVTKIEARSINVDDAGALTEAFAWWVTLPSEEERDIVNKALDAYLTTRINEIFGLKANIKDRASEEYTQLTDLYAYFDDMRTKLTDAWSATFLGDS